MIFRCMLIHSLADEWEITNWHYKLNLLDIATKYKPERLVDTFSSGGQQCAMYVKAHLQNMKEKVVYK